MTTTFGHQVDLEELTRLSLIKHPLVKSSTDIVINPFQQELRSSNLDSVVCKRHQLSSPILTLDP